MFTAAGYHRGVDPEVDALSATQMKPWTARKNGAMAALNTAITKRLDGSILGIATPTEAAGFGALGVLILAITYHVVSWEILVKSFAGSLRVTAMVLLIILASSTFSQLFAFTGTSSGLIAWATTVELAPVVMLLIMFAVLLVLGMLMDQVSMLLLTVPTFFPLAETLQFDLIWFGIVMLLALEISLTTTPFGLLLFVMIGSGAARHQPLAGRVCRCALHRMRLDRLRAPDSFPGIATCLPGLMSR